MSDFFKGELDSENIIDANKQICQQSNEPFGLDNPEKLDEIISNIRAIDRIEDEKEKVIRKISILIVGLSYDQPFKNGNKRTSLAISILLLRLAHYDISFHNKEQKKEVFDLLEGLMYKFEDDIPMLTDEVEDFLRSRIVKI